MRAGRRGRLSRGDREGAAESQSPGQRKKQTAEGCRGGVGEEGTLRTDLQTKPCGVTGDLDQTVSLDWGLSARSSAGDCK